MEEGYPQMSQMSQMNAEYKTRRSQMRFLWEAICVICAICGH